MNRTIPAFAIFLFIGFGVLRSDPAFTPLILINEVPALSTSSASLNCDITRFTKKIEDAAKADAMAMQRMTPGGVPAMSPQITAALQTLTDSSSIMCTTNLGVEKETALAPLRDRLQGKLDALDEQRAGDSCEEDSCRAAYNRKAVEAADAYLREVAPVYSRMKSSTLACITKREQAIAVILSAHASPLFEQQALAARSIDWSAASVYLSAYSEICTTAHDAALRFKTPQ